THSRGGCRAEGMPSDMSFAQLWTMRNGKRSGMEMYSDPEEARRAVGLAPWARRFQAPVGRRSPRICHNGAMIGKDQIRAALEAVIDPELHRSIVELDMVRSIETSANGVVDVTVSLTTPGWPVKGHFQNAVSEAV